MKKFLWLVLFLFPAVVTAQEGKYPWTLSIFGGRAALCDQLGCFGPTGYSGGASFGRHFTDRWAFELEGSFARTNELLPPRIDDFGNVFQPELQRTRIWGGGAFLATLAHLGSSEFFVALGLIGGYERQEEKTPPEIFHAPTRNIGVKGGVLGGAGLNLWLGKSWGIRPEVRFYAVAGATDTGTLSGLLYTAGIMKKF